MCKCTITLTQSNIVLAKQPFVIQTIMFSKAISSSNGTVIQKLQVLNSAHWIDLNFNSKGDISCQ